MASSPGALYPHEKARRLDLGIAFLLENIGSNDEILFFSGFSTMASAAAARYVNAKILRLFLAMWLLGHMIRGAVLSRHNTLPVSWDVVSGKRCLSTLPASEKRLRVSWHFGCRPSDLGHSAPLKHYAVPEPWELLFGRRAWGAMLPRKQHRTARKPCCPHARKA